jgi:hypothetical protein
VEKKKAHINITIDEDLNGWVEKMTSELKINKSQFINNILSVTRSDVKIYKAIGLVDVAKAAVKLKEECLKAGIQGFRLENLSLKRAKSGPHRVTRS